MKEIETIKDKNQNIVAIIILNNFSSKETNFFTPNDFPQQLAQIQRFKGEVIKAHTHKPIDVNITKTQETLFIKRGKVKVDLYDNERDLITSKILESGDVILLASGGHKFEALEDFEMIEVKQGPYLGDEYKTKL
ncbi:MAG: hypothetical protein HY219_02940 [Candidatus Staskawiczbacteria bacterium]|nr:hypothetical protein [Candidatus Staskawiczbacteria bacterium]